MKKFLSLIIAAVIMLAAMPALAAASDIVAASADLNHEELLEKALAENGTFIVYGNTSRITTALEDFCKLYGFTGEGNNLKDAEIYTKLENEVNGGGGADMVMIQDGAALVYAIEDGLLVNYIPAAIKDSVSQEDQNPLVQQFINKVFIYNNLGDNVPAIKNVWELTDPSFKGNIIFKNPEQEQVNMNFLIMLTSEEWSAKLTDAYKALKGEDIELGGYKNAGYKWIAEFLGNCTFGSSDTTIAEEISKETAGGKIGLFVLSKLRSSTVLTDNLTVAEYDANAESYTVEPFSGFIYPMYALVSSGASRPYTAMLFIEYLMTDAGFAPWGSSIGAYSSSSAIAPNEGDLGIDIWKASSVTEDPQFILDNYADVADFVIKYLQ
ncbi:MAG: ABC transporter substrate-binding protein [Oscillospiraceae bacterium]|jgi:iron(III) transport system substrate-binding protein|nr:ABC transporter substrate-binding protein [Oscillospiraceae bacterium]